MKDKFEKQFIEDFNESNKADLSFDVNQLEPNTRRNHHKIKPYKVGLIVSLSTVAILAVVIAVPLISALFRFKDSVNVFRRTYSLNEIRIAESNSFKSLNKIYYPNGDSPTKSEISVEEKEAYANYSNLTYHSIVDTSKKDNMSYSIVGLYSVMNEMSNAASREDLKTQLNNLLGLNEESRTSFYSKMMKANSFAKENSTIQLKNGAFFNNHLKYSEAFVTSLSKLYCEAYQLNFNSEINKVVEWVNQAVNSNGFIDKQFLELNNETELYLFSTLYFKNAWLNKYISSSNINDDFHLLDGSDIKVDYMRHSFGSEQYYDYGSYITVKDYYYARNASVTYLVPKSVDDNIFELTKTANIFIDKEENKVVSTNKYDPFFTINLKTPKFTLKTDLDFKNALTNLGFGDIFNRNIDSFKNAFDDPLADNYNIYVQKVKQRNEVEFNEDGSTVRSVTMASFGGATSAAPMVMDTLDVQLNQPFIYIIKDVNDTPIFVGHVDNPSLK